MSFELLPHQLMVAVRALFQPGEEFTENKLVERFQKNAHRINIPWPYWWRFDKCLGLTRNAGLLKWKIGSEKRASGWAMIYIYWYED